MSRKLDVQKRIDAFNKYVEKRPQSDFTYREIKEICNYLKLNKGMTDPFNVISTCLALGFMKGMYHEQWKSNERKA